MDKNEVKSRVEAKVKSGDFFFPEDLQRGIAEALGIDLAGTPLGQDPAAESRTRGSVPPFSGPLPANKDDATKDSAKMAEKFEKAQAERDDSPNRVTYADTGNPDDRLETEVKEEGPVYPDDESTSTNAEATNKTTKAKGGTK